MALELQMHYWARSSLAVYRGHADCRHEDDQNIHLRHSCILLYIQKCTVGTNAEQGKQEEGACLSLKQGVTTNTIRIKIKYFFTTIVICQIWSKV
ncbi:hypothetical protein K1719_001813 [Acacia pycnantha]|nr:hypothetical protein K1719_001813 [Acacia pycnantha]